MENSAILFYICDINIQTESTMRILKLFLSIIVSLIVLSGCKSQQITNDKISGIWMGEAYQYDVDQSWDIYFVMDAKNQVYTIDYPSLSCGGKWTLMKSNKNILEFREKLNRGFTVCTNNGKIVLKVKHKNEIDFYYYWPDDNTLSAQGILYRQ